MWAEARKTVGRGDGPLGLLSSLLSIFSETSELQPLLRRVLARVAAGLGADAAGVYLLSEGRLVLTAQYQTFGPPLSELDDSLRELGLDDEDMPIARCVNQRQPLCLKAEELPPRSRLMAQRLGIRSALCTPLMVREQAIGGVYLLKVDEPAFTAEAREVFEICAAQLAMAIDHARLFEAQRKQVEDFRLILQLGQTITRSHELPEILDRAVTNLLQLADATHAFIWLIDPATGLLQGAHSSSKEFAQAFRQQRMSVDATSLAGLAVRTGAPVQVSDATRSTAVNASLQAQFNFRGLMALPLLFGDKPVGAAIIGDTRRPRVLSDVELERVMVMASQLAIAVANARLFEDLKNSYHELARTQETLVQRERLAALGELAAVVAHEVRNPLGVIYNAMASLRRLLKPSGEAEVLFNFVREEAERLDTIVSDLLDFARPREAELRQYAAEGLISAAVKAVETHCQSSKVTLEQALPAGLPLMMADERMMRQALVNLLLNAVQAMPSGGALSIRASVEPTRTSSLRIDIEDTGPGIPAELAEKVFQPFYTTKATGSGLGLAVVRRILEAHHGQVWVDTGCPRGARLCLRVPSAPR